MLSTMSGRGRLPAAQKPYTLIPKPPNSGLHDPKDRARRSHVARGHALLPRADTCCALVFQNIDRQIPELNPPYNVSLPEFTSHLNYGIKINKVPSKVRSYSSRIRFWWKRFANGMQHNVRKEIVRTQYCQKKTVDSRNRVHRRAHG
jgi:hypothetical protein